MVGPSGSDSYVSGASGLMPSSAVVYANRIGLTEPIIGHQGALVRAIPVRREVVTDAGFDVLDVQHLSYAPATTTVPPEVQLFVYARHRDS